MARTQSQANTAEVDNTPKVARWSPLSEMAGSNLGQYVLHSDHQQAVDALRAEVERLQTEIDDKWAEGVHSCGDHCQRPACVMLRRAQRAEAQAAAIFDAMEELADDWAFNGWPDPAKDLRAALARAGKGDGS